MDMMKRRIRRKRRVILLQPRRPKPQPKPTLPKPEENYLSEAAAIETDEEDIDEEDTAIIQEPSALRKVLLYVSVAFNNSSTHGLVYITESKISPGENALWAVLVCLAIWGAASLGLSTYTRYMESPVVMSMERDRMSWNTTFPSITICPLVTISRRNLELNIQRRLKDKANYDMVSFLEIISNATFEDFKRLPTGLDLDNLNPDLYMDLIYESRIIVSLDASTGEGDWEPTIEETVVEGGLCYTYHTFVGVYNSVNYWKEGQMTLHPAKHPELKGHPAGGSILVSITGINENVKVTINSPYEVPDMSNSYTTCLKTKTLVEKTEALATVTTPEATSLSISQRNCRMPNENNLQITPVYSYSFCRMECRLKLAYRLCGCRPFFYRKIADFENTCNDTGLRCIGNIADLLKTLVDPETRKPMRECKCLPLCNEISYYITERNQGDAAETGAAIQIALDVYPSMRIKRDVIFGFADLLVSIGGSGGLFLGCSLLSLAEILYFLTLRLILCAHKLYTQWRLDKRKLKRQKKLQLQVTVPHLQHPRI